MSKVKYERNRTLVKLRKKDPNKWSWGRLAVKFGFKSRATPKQIFETFAERV